MRRRLRVDHDKVRKIPFAQKPPVFDLVTNRWIVRSFLNDLSDI